MIRLKTRIRINGPRDESPNLDERKLGSKYSRDVYSQVYNVLLCTLFFTGKNGGQVEQFLNLITFLNIVNSDHRERILIVNDL